MIAALREKANKIIVNKTINLISKASDQTIIKGLKIGSKLIKDPDYKEIAKNTIESNFEKNPNSLLQIKNILNYLPKKGKEKLITNLVYNMLVKGRKIRVALQEKEGYRYPVFGIISPTMRCNLRCIGCYAGDYTQKDDLHIEMVDSVIQQGKELGMYFFVILGGEPFIRKDILDIFEKHNDCYFLAYTNGTLITDDLAKKLAELGNVALAVSVEGFEHETDKRRGKGMHTKILKAMENLKKHRILFGFSCTVIKDNANKVGKKDFLQYYIDKGCKFGWYFQYIPIGLKPNVKLMTTPEQRKDFRAEVMENRRKKPIAVADFWNDGPLVDGCLAGRMYFHVICTGDVEPCVFCHFAVDNVKEKPLKDVLKSPFFKAIRAKNPYRENKNLLTPCMIIDNPEIMREVCKKCGAHSTHPGSDSIIKSPKITKHLDKYSKEYHKLMDPVWEKEYLNNPKSWWSKENYRKKYIDDKYK